MRILILNPEYPPVGGGSANACAHLAAKLAEMGQDVVVLTARYGNLPHDEQINGLRIQRVPALRRHKDRSGAFEQVAFILGGALGAIKLLRNWRPEVVLAFFGAPSGVIALALKLFFGLPYVVSLRGGDVPGFRPYDFALYHRLIGPLLHLVWRQAAGVVANSQGLRDLAAAFDPRVEIQIIPNGVAVEAFATHERQWAPPHLLSVGRVVHQKGFDLLLQALGSLVDLDWRLSIAGDGPLRGDLEAMANSLDIVERVRFLGWLDKADLISHYHQANLFVYPSRHEGMPNAVLEAMASGLPVLASRIAGSEELVVEGETGLLIPPEDVEALAVALRELVPDAARRQRLGAAGYRRVAENYSWDMVAERYLALLRASLEAG